MKGLKKLALVSAIAMTSAGAFAMEVADDSVLSETTGQQGITIDVAMGKMYASALVSSFGVDATGAITTHNALGTAGLVRGITIGSVVIHDADGLTGVNSAFTGDHGAVDLNFDGDTADAGESAAVSGSSITDKGAIVIGGGAQGASAAQKLADSTVVFSDDVDPIVIKVDSASNGGKPLLNVGITTPELVIKTGAIYVATSNGVGAALGNDKTKILNGMELVLGATTINVQLGHEAQKFDVLSPMGAGSLSASSALVLVSADLINGLTINKTQIDDVDGTTSGGSIYVGSMKVTDHGDATKLHAVVGVNVTSDLTDPAKTEGTCATCFSNDSLANKGGLTVTLGQLGTSAAGGGIDVTMTDVRLGAVDATSAATLATSAASIGDIEILGLNLNGTSLIIHGH